MCIDIAKNTYDKERFDRWIKAQQKYVDAFESGQDTIEIESVEEDDKKFGYYHFKHSVFRFSYLQRHLVTGSRENNTKITLI